MRPNCIRFAQLDLSASTIAIDGKTESTVVVTLAYSDCQSDYCSHFGHNIRLHRLPRQYASLSSRRVPQPRDRERLGHSKHGLRFRRYVFHGAFSTNVS